MWGFYLGAVFFFFEFQSLLSLIDQCHSKLRPSDESAYSANCGVLMLYYFLLVAAAVAEWVRALPRKRKVGSSNPSRDIPKSLKQIVTAPLQNDRH